MPTRKLALGPPWCARVPIRKKRRVRGVCHPAPCIPPEYRSARAGRVCTLFDCSSCCVHAETGKPWVSRRVKPASCSDSVRLSTSTGTPASTGKFIFGALLPVWRAQENKTPPPCRRARARVPSSVSERKEPPRKRPGKRFCATSGLGSLRNWRSVKPRRPRKLQRHGLPERLRQRFASNAKCAGKRLAQLWLPHADGPRRRHAARLTFLLLVAHRPRLLLVTSLASVCHKLWCSKRRISSSKLATIQVHVRSLVEMCLPSLFAWQARAPAYARGSLIVVMAHTVSRTSRRPQALAASPCR